MKIGTLALAAASLCSVLGTLKVSAAPADVKKEKTNPLRGIIIVDYPDKVLGNDPRTNVDGVVVEGPGFLKPFEGELSRKLAPYMGRNLPDGNYRWLTNVLHDVVGFCREHDRPVVDVFLPAEAMDQSPVAIEQGRIYVVVFEGKVGSVGLSKYSIGPFGGPPKPREVSHSETNRIEKMFAITPGSPISQASLDRELLRLNRDPYYRSANLTLQPGEVLGEAKVSVVITNRFPVEVNGGYDNAGNTLIGLNRVSGGATYHNLWDAGHAAAYQYTTDVDLDHYKAHVGSYLMPVPWGGTLLGYGTYAQISADLAQIDPKLKNINEKGDNYSVGLRYTLPLNDVMKNDGGLRFRHEVFAALDYKNINSTLEFSAQYGGVSNPLADYTVAEATLGWRGMLIDSWGTNAFGVQIISSPGGITAKNDDAAYGLSRPGAKSSFVVGKFSFARETPLFCKALSWNIDVEGQYSSDSLVASEQFSLGGASTVRGFEQGVLLGDHAYVIRNELNVPIPVVGRWFSVSGQPGVLKLHGFFDYGVNYFAGSQSGNRSGISIGGAGAGVTVKIGRNLDATVDYGYQVIGRDAESLGGSGAKNVDAFLHAAVQLRF